MGKWSVEGQITGVWRLERIHEYSLKEGKDVIHNGSFMGHFIHEKKWQSVAAQFASMQIYRKASQYRCSKPFLKRLIPCTSKEHSKLSAVKNHV